MNTIKADKIAHCLGVSLNTREHIACVTTDSRQITENSIFIALEGENFDGHNYINYALEHGSLYAVAHKKGDYLQENRVLYVENTAQALLDIASYYRKQLPIKVVAVTGSVGKTTTKEMIDSVLKSNFNTHKTKANLNNTIGMPKTLLELEETHEVAVIEMGMDTSGEIEKMSISAIPDIAVITNIGVSHIENLGSRENIRDAKLEIIKGMKKNSTIVVCADNDLLENLELQDFNLIKVGIDAQNIQIKAENIEENFGNTKFDILYHGGMYHAVLPTLGKHNVLNALLAFAVGVQLGIDPEQCANALENFKNTGMRQRVVAFKGYTIIEDCYNASPDSMKAAIDTLSQQKGRKIAVFSDMLELGECGQVLHTKIGEYIADSNIDIVYAYGDLARYYTKELYNKQSFYFNCKEELFISLKSKLKSGDTIWFKGSRGMKLEDIIEKIYNNL